VGRRDRLTVWIVGAAGGDGGGLDGGYGEAAEVSDDA
jgi:hypothetical protein